MNELHVGVVVAIVVGLPQTTHHVDHNVGTLHLKKSLRKREENEKRTRREREGKEKRRGEGGDTRKNKKGKEKRKEERRTRDKWNRSVKGFLFCEVDWKRNDLQTELVMCACRGVNMLRCLLLFFKLGEKEQKKREEESDRERKSERSRNREAETLPRSPMTLSRLKTKFN